MSFQGFAEKALERGRRKQVHTRWQRIRSRLIIIVIIVGVVLAAGYWANRAFQSSQQETSGWSVSHVFTQDDYTQDDIVDIAAYGVHLNAADKIDKVYEYNDLQKMSKKQRTADNVVLFLQDGRIDGPPYPFAVPTTVTADGVSYPFDASFDMSIASLSDAVTAYNAAVNKGAGITLRGDKGEISLGYYLLDVLSSKVTNAVKTGLLSAPTVAYDGTGTEYHNTDVATAYNAGVNVDLFDQPCSQGAEPSVNSYCGGNAAYDFSCKTIGVKYTDWSTFRDQLSQMIGLPELRISTPTLGQLAVNTLKPCRIKQDGGTPVPPVILPGEPDESEGF